MNYFFNVNLYIIIIYVYKNIFSLKNKKIYYFLFFLKYKVFENFIIIVDCYINDGKFYRGFVNIIEKGFNC